MVREDEDAAQREGVSADGAMSVVFAIVAAVALVGLLAGLAFSRAQLHKQFGAEAGSAQFRAMSRRGLPLIVVLTALPLALLVLIPGAEVETTQRLTWILSALMLGATCVIATRAFTRDRRLGHALVTVPAARWMRLGSVVIGVMGIVNLLLWLATFVIAGKLRAVPATPVFLIICAWQQARCSVEIRSGGVCNALSEWRWAKVHSWAWEPTSLRPMLRLSIGRWGIVHWEIPEQQRAAVDMAFAEFAGAKR